eukprot:gene8164-1418_t
MSDAHPKLPMLTAKVPFVTWQPRILAALQSKGLDKFLLTPAITGLATSEGLSATSRGATAGGGTKPVRRTVSQGGASRTNPLFDDGFNASDSKAMGFIRTLKFEAKETVDTFLTRSYTLYSRLMTTSDAVTEHTLCQKILDALPLHWESFVFAVRFHQSDQQKYDVLADQMRQTESQMQSKAPFVKTNAFSATTAAKHRSPATTHGKSKFKPKFVQTTTEKQSGSAPFFPGECRYCHVRGHKEMDCPQKASDDSWHTSDNLPGPISRRNAYMAVLADEKPAVTSPPKPTVRFSAFATTCRPALSLFRTPVGPLKSSLLPVRTFTKFSDQFQELHSTSPQILTGATGVDIVITQAGTVFLETDCSGSPTIIVLREVLYCPQVSASLISRKVLDNHGWTWRGGGGFDYLYDDTGSLGLVAKLNNSQYEVTALPVMRTTERAEVAMYIAHALLVTPPLSSHADTTPGEEGIIPTSNLWHRRFGHLHYADLRKLSSGLVKGIPPIEARACPRDCRICIQAKGSRPPFRASITQTTQPLALLHIDLCGPMQTPTLGGGRYFMGTTDDYTGFAIVSILAGKSGPEIYAHLTTIISKLENLTGFKVQILRTDGGGEFCNNAMSAYLDAKGISHHTTTPYTPQSNGVAERQNRTLVSMTRAMLVDQVLGIMLGYASENFQPGATLSKAYKVQAADGHIVVSRDVRFLERGRLSVSSIPLPSAVPEEEEESEAGLTEGLPWWDDEEEHVPHYVVQQTAGAWGVPSYGESSKVSSSSESAATGNEDEQEELVPEQEELVPEQEELVPEQEELWAEHEELEDEEAFSTPLANTPAPTPAPAPRRTTRTSEPPRRLGLKTAITPMIAILTSAKNAFAQPE